MTLPVDPANPFPPRDECPTCGCPIRCEGGMYEALYRALAELVDLKFNRGADYEARKPGAWAAAQVAVEGYRKSPE